jgi:hypothetical protein
VASKTGYDNSPAFCAIFNLDDQPLTVHFTWDEIGFTARKQSHDLFTGSKVAAWKPVILTLPAHGSAIYRVE